jgi:hypothetical protein
MTYILTVKDCTPEERNSNALNVVLQSTTYRLTAEDYTPAERNINALNVLLQSTISFNTFVPNIVAKRE